jgi:hypothetical protein
MTRKSSGCQAFFAANKIYFQHHFGVFRRNYAVDSNETRWLPSSEATVCCALFRGNGSGKRFRVRYCGTTGSGGSAAKHKRRGCHAKLALEDILFMALKYRRQYVTQKELIFEFGVGEAAVHDWIVWTENTLVKSGGFRLPGKKALLEDNDIEVALVDVTESPIERPEKNSVAGIPAKRSATRAKRS